MTLNDLFTKASIESGVLSIDLNEFENIKADNPQSVLWALLTDLYEHYSKIPVNPADNSLQITFNHGAPRIAPGATQQAPARPLNLVTQNFSLSFNGAYEVSAFEPGVTN